MHCIVRRACGGPTDDDNRTARATGHRPDRRRPRPDLMAIHVIGRAANALILGLGACLLSTGSEGLRRRRPGDALNYSALVRYRLPMRHRLLASLMLVALAADSAAAERRWQSGTWRDSGDTRTYVILTETVRLHLEDLPPAEARAMTVAAGSRVGFAIEDSHVFVLDRDGKEHELRLVRRVDLTYTAVGAGHFIKSVCPEGASVTLEDGSIWELDPRAEFFTARWQPLENIAVRRTEPNRGFTYEIDNIDQDNGAPARYSPR